jgi:ribonuclease HII
MKRLFISTVLASLLAGTTLFAANPTSKEVNKQTVAQAKSDAQHSQEKLLKDSVGALLLTQKTLVDLAHNKIDEAIKDLEGAIGKLEVILASRNAPKLLPVQSTVVAYEYAGDIKALLKAISEVKLLIAANKLQDARILLDTLRSELVISTVNIPLATYPDALKLAAKYLHEGKVQEAIAVLDAALNTLVQTEVIIPLPILKAEGLIKAASIIAKTDKEQALKHLDQAKKELVIAQTLGYVSRSSTTYKMLKEAIENVEKEIKGKNEVAKLFEELLNKIKEFKEKAVKHTDNSAQPAQQENNNSK